MEEITYLKGDATRPIGDGQKLILHICNDIGAWGAGFVLAISKRWKEPENEYRNWSRRGSLGDFKLGEVQLVSVEENITVINMIAQRDIRWNGNNPPIRYDALETALGKVVEIMQRTDLKDASLHMPRIGCGLAGGKWENVEQILKTQISMKIDNKIYVYDL